MAKDTKSLSSAVTGKSLTDPIGSKKAVKFAEVEGLKMSPAAKTLAQKLTAIGLKGDAYRSEIMKSFKKG